MTRSVFDRYRIVSERDQVEAARRLDSLGRLIAPVRHYFCRIVILSAKSMIATEKIAATYLRLNGFLLLPQFTVFIGGDHGHVDLVGLRAKGSKEQAGQFVFPIDEKFFNAIDHLISANPLEEFLGLVGEVKTNRKKDHPQKDQVEYIKPFLGNVPVVPVFFSDAGKEPTWKEDCVHVGNSYALNWIFDRVSFMNANLDKVTKGGSWTLSEDALSEILVLGRLVGRIKEKPRDKPP